jgi:maleate isomerase
VSEALHHGLDYGRAGRVGVATPQANPTVEQEFAILLPRSMSLTVTRLRSTAPSAMVRLVEYFDHLDDSLAAYDVFKPDVFGIACTGSSYVVGRDREAGYIAAAAAKVGYAIDTAGQAIAWAMDRLGARRIGIVAPYPKDLVEAGVAYWQSWGLEVPAVERVETGSADTRSIYGLVSADAAAGLARLDTRGLDAVLLSGTGLPTLPALAASDVGVPVITSNGALAARLLSRLGREDLLDLATLEIAGWRARLAEALA